ncbi:MAG: hypothetical protein Q4F66_00220 [Clostridium sp.]|nr:hypothetical protein [Clostridium sp.]
MDYNLYGFEDIFRACGYDPGNNFSGSDKTAFDGNFRSNNNRKKDNSDDGVEGGNSGAGGWNPFTGFASNCNDIPNGFQAMYPELFVVIGEIIANIISRKLPINVQDAFGNWLQLIGQVILTYNAQQQYFQSGPGRYFSPIYYNVSNPFCTEDPYEMNNGNADCCESDEENSHKRKKVSQKDISKLDNNINELVKEINSLKDQIEKINSRMEQE